MTPTRRGIGRVVMLVGSAMLIGTIMAAGCRQQPYPPFPEAPPACAQREATGGEGACEETSPAQAETRTAR